MGFLRLLVFLVLAAVFGLQLRSIYGIIYWPELLLAFSGLLSFFLNDPRFLLGFALPTVPFFEYGTLSCFILTYSAGLILKDTKLRSFEKKPKCTLTKVLLITRSGGREEGREGGDINFFILLLLSPLLISLIYTLIQEVDLYLLKTILLNVGLLGLFRHIQAEYPIWDKALFHFASFVNFSLLLLVLPSDCLVSKKFAKGLACGVIFLKNGAALLSST